MVVKTNFFLYVFLSLFQVYKKYRKGRYHKCHHSIFFNKWSSLSLFFLGFCFHGNFFVLFWIFVFTEKNGFIDFFTWWWHNWYIHKVIHNTFPLGRKPSYFRIRKYLFFIFALCLFGENRILALWTCQNINLLQKKNSTNMLIIFFN